jgi:transposase InsO family protein
LRAKYQQDDRRFAGCRVAGEREHRGGADARAAPGGAAQEAAQVLDAAGPGSVADLVKRDFPASRINQKWYGDGTEIATSEGKLHLASVLDMASRSVRGSRWVRTMMRSWPMARWSWPWRCAAGRCPA